MTRTRRKSDSGQAKNSPLFGKGRVWLAAPFVVVAAALAVPAFVLRHVPVDVDVTVSQIEFDTDGAYIAGLFGQTFANAVTFSGFDEVSFSTGEVWLTNNPRPVSGPVNRFLSTGKDSQIEFM